MPDPEQPARPQRDYVAAKNRRDAVKHLTSVNPMLKALYRAGSDDDGKAGWINAIRDQREPVYRLIFYLDRIPIAKDYRDQDAFELLFGDFGDEPNFPRAVYTTTGGIALVRHDLPDVQFAAAIKTDSLEIVPLSMERDMRTTHLLDSGIAYICVYDAERQGLRILDLKEFHEVYVSKDNQEVQVRDEERIIVGDTRFVRAFFLRYSVKRAGDSSLNPSEAAGKFLTD